MNNTVNVNNAVKDFVKTIALGVAVCEVIALLAFLVAGKFSLPVFFGALWGGVVMLLYYLLMARATAKAADEADPDIAKKRIQASYSKRLLFLALSMGVGVYLAAEYEILHWLPLVLSMIYPRISIAVWQIVNSKKLKAQDAPADKLEPLPFDDEEDADL